MLTLENRFIYLINVNRGVQPAHTTQFNLTDITRSFELMLI